LKSNPTDNVKMVTLMILRFLIYRAEHSNQHIRIISEWSCDTEDWSSFSH